MGMDIFKNGSIFVKVNFFFRRYFFKIGVGGFFGFPLPHQVLALGDFACVSPSGLGARQVMCFVNNISIKWLLLFLKKFKRV
jgi:hypothetical protein